MCLCAARRRGVGLRRRGLRLPSDDYILRRRLKLDATAARAPSTARSAATMKRQVMLGDIELLCAAEVTRIKRARARWPAPRDARAKAAAAGRRRGGGEAMEEEDPISYEIGTPSGSCARRDAGEGGGSARRRRRRSGREGERKREEANAALAARRAQETRSAWSGSFR